MRTKTEVIANMQEIIDEIKSSITDCTIAIPESKTYFYLAKGESILCFWYDDWAFGTHHVSLPIIPSIENGSSIGLYSDTTRPSIDKINTLITLYISGKIKQYKSIEDYMVKNSWTKYEIINI